MITFEDFKKLEIKIGTIESAEKVSGSDRLLKVIVDMGNKKCQVVAGFGHYISPENLIGKQVPIVVNIEPTKLRGIESQGIFVAIDAGEAVLLIPEKKVPSGSIVR